ncbi:MAG: TlpA family protein disulfide reductase [Gemmatimonadetes bacterium]|nr:TlpA family protein disulfide reductase [Gemmatimonadota bacterium]
MISGRSPGHAMAQAARVSAPRGPLSLALGFALMLVACVPSGGLRQGDPLPEFSATSLLGGQPVSLSDYEGQVLLVNLWATWCVPCRTETPYLQSLYETYREEGLRIVGISVDLESSVGEVEAFIEEMGVSYDILLDPKGRSETAFQARGMRNSILVGRDGTVLFSWLGPIEEGDPTFLAGLQQALSATRHSAAEG